MNGGALAAIVAAALVAAVGLATSLALVPDCTDRLRDDAYYVFTWAHNLATGHGPTVSSGTGTSGVQFLWALLLAAVDRLRPAALPLPQLAAWLGFACHLLAAGSWMLAGPRRAAAVCVGLLWLGNPLLLHECQNGQETALAALLLTWLWLCRRRRERVFLPLAVLAVLARTDLCLPVLLLSCVRHRRLLRALPAPALALAAVMGLSWWSSGSLLQDSGPPMAWLFHAAFAATGPDLGDWLLRQWWYTRPVLLGGPWTEVSAPALGLAVFFVLRPLLPARLRLLPLLLVLLALPVAGDLATAVVSATLLAVAPRRRRRPPPRALAALLLAVVGILLLHWAGRWYPRSYYLAPLAVVAAAATARLGRRPLALLLLALLQLVSLPLREPEDLRGQEAMQLAGRVVDQLLPGRPRLGCFNSGIVTWQRLPAGGGDGRVFNLDGVVDRRAFAALRAGALAAHLDRQQVCLLLDNPVEFAADVRLPHACGRWFGGGFAAADDLVELARFLLPSLPVARPQADHVALYWRRRCGAPPPMPTAARLLGPRPGGGCYLLWPAAAGQVLEREAGDGSRTAVAVATADTVMVLGLTAGELGTGRLFVRGAVAPLLTVSGL